MIFNQSHIRKFQLPVFLLFLLVFTTSSISAQETRIGVKAGLNYASVVGDLTQGFKFRFSGYGGLFLEIEFSDKFSFQPELLYSSQGFQLSSDLQSIETGNTAPEENDFRTNVQFNYITIPVLGKFAINDRMAVEFGPQFGFLLNQVTKIKNLDQRNNSTANSRSTISGNFQLDYGAAAGLSYKLSDHFALAPRFYIGLRNRLEGLEGNLQNYNAAIQLGVNYTFL